MWSRHEDLPAKIERFLTTMPGGWSSVLVSQTVKDLVAGSGLAFEDAGEHEP